MAAVRVQKGKEKSRFRIKAKNYFLTYPKCGMDLGDVKEQMEKIFGIDEIKFVRVASEKHADGTMHRHVLVMLRNEQAFGSCDFADLRVPVGTNFESFHGNYVAAKSPSAVYRYVSKGKDFISFGEDPKFTEKKTGAIGQICRAIEAGKTPADIRAEFPQIYFMQKKKVDEFYMDTVLGAKAKELLEWDTVGMKERLAQAKERGAPECLLQLGEWLVGNIGLKRKFKQKQLYLHGPPDYGKTSLIQALSRFGPVYFAPTDEHFFDEFNDSLHRFVVFDEFKGNHPVTFMNQFLEMGVMTVRKKGSQALRTKNIPVIICSNYSPSLAYGKMSPQSLVGFLTRLEVVELTVPLFPVIDAIMECHAINNDKSS